MSKAQQEQGVIGGSRPLMLEQLPADVRPTPREVALSLAVAVQMQDVPEVQRFRRDWLADGVLAWDQVERWLARNSAPAGLPSLFLTESEPLPAEVSRLIISKESDDTRVEIPTTLGALRHDYGVRPLALHYGLPPGEQESTQSICGEAPFVELLRLSTRLAEHVTWMEAQATIFVLTGLTPLIPQFTTRLVPNILMPALSRVELRVDPRLSPHDVTEHYRQVRTALVGTYHRDITEKHLQLALFAVSPEGRAGTFRTRMARWNAQQPQWAYASVSNFGRDMSLAVRRLLGVSNKGRR